MAAGGAFLSGIVDLSRDDSDNGTDADTTRPSLAEIRAGYTMAKTLSRNGALQSSRGGHTPRPRDALPDAVLDFGQPRIALSTEKSPQFQHTLKRTIDGLLKDAQASGRYTDYRLDRLAEQSSGGPTIPGAGATAGHGTSRSNVRLEGRTSFTALFAAAQAEDVSDEEQADFGVDNQRSPDAAGGPRTADRRTRRASTSLSGPSANNVQRDPSPTDDESSEEAERLLGSFRSATHRTSHDSSKAPDSAVLGPPEGRFSGLEQNDTVDASIGPGRPAQRDGTDRFVTGRDEPNGVPGGVAQPDPVSLNSKLGDFVSRASPRQISRFAKAQIKRQKAARTAMFEQNGSQIRQRQHPERQPKTWAGLPPGAEVIDITDEREEQPMQPIQREERHSTRTTAITGNLPPDLVADRLVWSKRKPSERGEPFTPDERRKISELRLFHGLTFDQIAPWFPGRTMPVIATTWNKSIETKLDEYLTPAELLRYVPQVVETLTRRGTPIPASYMRVLANGKVPAVRGPTTTNAQLPPRKRGRPRKVPAAAPIPELTVVQYEVPSLPRYKQPVNERPRRDVARPFDYYAPVPVEDNQHLPHSDVGDQMRIDKQSVRHRVETTNAEPQDVPRTEPPTSRLRRIRRSPRNEPQADPKPYLTFDERRSVRRGFHTHSWDPQKLGPWRGAPLHVDFSPVETLEVYEAINAVLNGGRRPDACDISVRDLLSDAGEAELQRVTWHIQSKEKLPSRTRDDVEAFLDDLKHGSVTGRPVKLRLGGARSVGGGRSSLMRSRELGSQPAKTRTALRDVMLADLRPSRYFEKTSGDVGTVAWAPDGMSFAAGSMALVDPDSMQYNVPNNLLLGDTRGDIRELAAHFTRRERPASGPNATNEMHVTQDPRLFTTVSQVDFSSDGALMYSAGYDGVVRYWDTASPEPALTGSVDHGAAVDLLAVKAAPPHSDEHVVATGCQLSEGSVKVIRCDGTKVPLLAYSSVHALAKPHAKLFPSALRWGINPYVSDFLLAGFATNRSDAEDGPETLGGVSMWDVRRGGQNDAAIRVHPNTRNVFDVAWSPHAALFAVACTAGNNRGDRRTRSEVKLYPLRDGPSFTQLMTLECAASDINDIVFSPYDDSLLSVGCTDGSVYMWDLRQPSRLLHQFSHRKPLQVLQYETLREREKLDTGVRFTSWSHARDRLYTGSSDGIVTLWDPYRATNDAKQRDLVQLDSGVMSGSFSSDYTKLLLGSVNGRIDILEVGSEHRSIRSSTPLRKVNAPDTSTKKPATEDADSGISSAKALLASEAISIRDLGALPIRQAVQGPSYHTTPFLDTAPDAPALRGQAAAFQSRLRSQLLSLDACTARNCKEYSKGARVTAEASGDSGRSADRIPQALRELRAPDEDDNGGGILMSGMARCARCGRPARVAFGDDDDVGDSGEAAAPRCERCRMSCFRCGADAVYVAAGSASTVIAPTAAPAPAPAPALAAPDPSADHVHCAACGMTWRADALGYALVAEPQPAPATAHDRPPRWQRRCRRWAKGITRLKDAVAYDDELADGEREMLSEQVFHLDGVYSRFEAVVDGDFVRGS